MAHAEQQRFVASVREQWPEFFSGTKVVEIGSLIINGSVRQFFSSPLNYVGIDLADGPGVDVVCEGQNYDAADGSFDCAISAECFEHNPFWKQTFANMMRLVRDGGLVVMTCATHGRPEHGTSRSDRGSSPLTIDKGWEYYRNLGEEDFRAEWNFDELFSSYSFSSNEASHDLYFWGIKKAS